MSLMIMKMELSLSNVPGLIFTALAFAVTWALCLDYTDRQLEFEPLICTVEQNDQILDNYDILQIAKDMASPRHYEIANFSINRTVISPEDVFDFVTKGCSLLNPFCAAVITIASCPVILTIDDWTADHSIPHIIYCTDFTPCHVTSTHSLHLTPDGSIKSNVVDNLIQKILKWKELLFIYDDYLDMVQLTRLQFALSNSMVSYGAFNIHSELTDQTFLDLVNATKEIRHIFLAVNSHMMDPILEMASMANLFTRDYQWIIMSNTSCLNALNKTLLRKSSVVFLRQTPFIQDLDENSCLISGMDRNYTEENADLLSSGIEAFIRASVDVDLYSKISQSTSVCDRRLTYLRRKAISETKKMTISTDGGVVVFGASNGKVASYGFQFCSTDDTRSVGYAPVGSWSPVNGLKTQHSLFKNAFRDFGGRKLLIASLEAKPFVIKTITDNRTYYEGFCFDLLDELANQLNFTYDVVEPSDETWGAPDDNNVWGGVIGMVGRGEAEIGIGPLVITSLREKVVDFTIPYMEDGIGIITKKAKQDSDAMFRLFTPLQPVVWMCLMASVIGVSLILYFVNRQSPSPPDRLTRLNQDDLSLFTCFWGILGSTFNQGADIQPKSNSGRLVLGSWWVFTIIFVSTYTANMAAVLTVTIYDKPINSITELATQSEIKPLVKMGSNAHTLFKNATNEIYRDIWKQMDHMPIVRTNEEGLALVRHKNFAFMTDRTQLEYVVLKDCETYALADDIFNTGGMGFVVQENAAFLTALDVIIMKLQESGIIDGWRRRWWSSQGNKCTGNDRVSTVAQLDLLYLAGPFFIFLGAMGLSIVVVVVERVFMVNRCKRLRRSILKLNAASSSQYCAKD